MEDMTMTEIARLIEGLRSAGWEEKKINDFLLYIESGSEEFKPKEENRLGSSSGAVFFALVGTMFPKCIQIVSKMFPQI